MLTIFKKYNLTNKKCVLILFILFIFNITITFKFIQAKSALNTSTFISYNLVKDTLRKVKYPDKIESEEGMKRLVDITKEINKNLEILEFNLRYSKITYDNDQFHLLINQLKNSLNKFISQHNKYFESTKTTTPLQLAKYEKLKSELVMIEHYLNKLGTSQSNQFGIQQYRVALLGKEQYNWYSKLEERVLNIEGIVGN